MAILGNTLYIGGSFSSVDGVAANNIAQWDGTNWAALGSGVDGNVSALAVSGGNIYVGGGFSMADGAPADRVAVWNGVNWAALCMAAWQRNRSRFGFGMDASIV